MDILFEIIFSIIFEGSIEGMKTKELPMWLRILCAIIVGLMFLFVLGIIGFIAISMWNERNYIPSSLFIILDFIFVIFVIKKLKILNNKI